MSEAGVAEPSLEQRSRAAVWGQRRCTTREGCMTRRHRWSGCNRAGCWGEDCRWGVHRGQFTGKAHASCRSGIVNHPAHGVLGLTVAGLCVVGGVLGAVRSVGHCGAVGRPGNRPRSGAITSAIGRARFVPNANVLTRRGIVNMSRIGVRRGRRGSCIGEQTHHAFFVRRGVAELAVGTVALEGHRIAITSLASGARSFNVGTVPCRSVRATCSCTVGRTVASGGQAIMTLLFCVMLRTLRGKAWCALGG